MHTLFLLIHLALLAKRDVKSLAVVQESSANFCFLKEWGVMVWQCTGCRHMGEPATIYSARQHYDLTIHNKYTVDTLRMACKHSTDSARVIWFKMVKKPWSVVCFHFHISVSVFTEIVLCCVYDATLPSNSSHQMIRVRATQIDSKWIGSSALCFYELYLSMHAGGRSLFLSRCYVAHTQGQTGGMN